MGILLFVIVTAVATIAQDSPPASCASHAVPARGQRFEKPAFKGVELYSWKTPDGAFRFSLHWGTNRNKTESEIKSTTCTLPDASAVRAALSHLAVGEWVTWIGAAREIDLAYPSREVIETLRAHSKALGITLMVPTQRR